MSADVTNKFSSFKTVYWNFTEIQVISVVQIDSLSLPFFQNQWLNPYQDLVLGNEFILWLCACVCTSKRDSGDWTFIRDYVGIVVFPLWETLWTYLLEKCYINSHCYYWSSLERADRAQHCYRQESNANVRSHFRYCSLACLKYI